MTIEQSKIVKSLVEELEMLTAHYERTKYFRDNRKRWVLEVETDSRRSGTFQLDLEDSAVGCLFDKKLKVIAARIEDTRVEIEKLKL